MSANRVYQQQPDRSPSHQPNAPTSDSPAPIEVADIAPGAMMDNVMRSLEQNPQAATPPQEFVQPKLTIGEPNDKYEREADCVAKEASQRMQTSEPLPLANPNRGNPIQRFFGDSKQDALEPTEIEPSLQRRTDAFHKIWRPLLQGKGAERGTTSEEFDRTLSRARSGGQALDSGLQQKMGKAIGADFSGVKIHTDSTADRLSESIQAKAFTTGRDVFFKRGAYQPGSTGGQELIAHELTHVVQQSGGEVQRKNEGTIQRSLVDAHNQELYWVDAVVKLKKALANSKKAQNLQYSAKALQAIVMHFIKQSSALTISDILDEAISMIANDSIPGYQKQAKKSKKKTKKKVTIADIAKDLEANDSNSDAKQDDSDAKKFEFEDDLDDETETKIVSARSFTMGLGDDDSEPTNPRLAILRNAVNEYKLGINSDDYKTENEEEQAIYAKFSASGFEKEDVDALLFPSDQQDTVQIPQAFQPQDLIQLSGAGACNAASSIAGLQMSDSKKLEAMLLRDDGQNAYFKFGSPDALKPFIQYTEHEIAKKGLINMYRVMKNNEYKVEKKLIEHDLMPASKEPWSNYFFQALHQHQIEIADALEAGKDDIFEFYEVDRKISEVQDAEQGARKTIVFNIITGDIGREFENSDDLLKAYSEDALIGKTIKFNAGTVDRPHAVVLVIKKDGSKQYYDNEGKLPSDLGFVGEGDPGNAVLAWPAAKTVADIFHEMKWDSHSISAVY
ncbi:MAG: DUF4157 domain-containing protein [Cyanobacteria bacterium P01_E01_bin.42]